jgi:hypothetical protein
VTTCSAIAATRTSGFTLSTQVLYKQRIEGRLYRRFSSSTQPNLKHNDVTIHNAGIFMHWKRLKQMIVATAID